MKISKKLILVIITLIFSANAFAQKVPGKTLFEGWFQVFLGAKKIGYLVERYQFEDNKFKYVSYLKTNADGNNVTESLNAISGPDLAPISSSYTTKVGDQVKTVDATFKKDIMTVVTFDGKKKTQESKKIKKGTFLSTFLMYLMLEQNGLKVGNKFDYYGIAEEEGKAYLGTVDVKTKEPVRGKEAFRLTNEFKGSKFIVWVTPHGEPLLMRQPENNIDVRFAETQKEATSDMTVNMKDLNLLFGKVPGDLSAKNSSSDGIQDNTADAKKADAKKKKILGKKPTDSTGPGNGVEIHNMAPPPKAEEPATPTTSQ